MYLLRIDCSVDLDECPEFEFETLSKMIEFMEVCFNNGYDVFIKNEEVE